MKTCSESFAEEDEAELGAFSVHVLQLHARLVGGALEFAEVHRGAKPGRM